MKYWFFSLCFCVAGLVVDSAVDVYCLHTKFSFSALCFLLLEPKSILVILFHFGLQSVRIGFSNAVFGITVIIHFVHIAPALF